MIPANELRIGNWVQFMSETGFVEYVQVVEINQVDFVAEGDEVFHNEKYDGPKEPIPLTPEILEKAGFSKLQDWFDKGAIVLSKEMEAMFETPYSEQISVKVEYLHQLQNLYFALTGEELNISL